MSWGRGQNESAPFEPCFPYRRSSGCGQQCHKRQVPGMRLHQRATAISAH